MAQTFEKLSSFFGRVKHAGFRDRVLPWRWRKVANLASKAYLECQQLADLLNQRVLDLRETKDAVATLQAGKEQDALTISRLEQELHYLGRELESEKAETSRLKLTVSARDETIRYWEADLTRTQSEIGRFQERFEKLSRETADLKEVIAAVKWAEASAREDYEKKMAPLMPRQ
jgi:chromosome segregation ATPase